MTKKVLIVEDEIFVALEIEDVVRSAGLHVAAIAADKDSALDHAAGVDIAFVDLNLRDGPTGVDIGRSLAQDYGVRVIYVTANPSQIGDATGVALGVICKPFRDVTVRQAVMLAARDEVTVDDLDIAGFIPFLPVSGASQGQGLSA